MFFTRIGGVIAWLAFAVGALRMLMAFSIAQSEDYAVQARRYLGSKTPGEAIDQGLMVLLFGIGLGILVEISRSVRFPRD